MPRFVAALGSAAVIVVAAALTLNVVVNPQRAGGPPSSGSPSSSQSPISGGMWPQSTLEEVRAAQERADAGDPDYTWQVDSQLFTDDTWTTKEPGQVEIVDRFLREVLGWEAYVLNPWAGMVRDGVYDVFYDQRYLRCAPGNTNPLYPPGPEPESGELCAPTIDDFSYESVSLDLAQLDRQDRDGIWVVNRWGLTAPFLQADPVTVEAQATGRLEEFLAARIAGTGAEGRVQVDSDIDVPLLYATTSGAPYERYEIERVSGPQWPYGRMTFAARLFAAGDATVVEQEISWRRMAGCGWTTFPRPRTASRSSCPSPPRTVRSPPRRRAHGLAIGPGRPLTDSPRTCGSDSCGEVPNIDGKEQIGFVDPVAYDAWCAENGGSPLLSAPADAAGIAQQVIADPDFETTAPVAARIGGLEAVSIDVALAPGGEACGVGMIEISRWIHTIGWDPGLRLRLYLVDLPDGMSVETLAISVVAPEGRFEEFIEETAPIIESIEFHAP